MELNVKKADNVGVKPMLGKEPMPNGELVSEALSIISVKDADDDHDTDRVVRRNSFRNLHRPDISYLAWVRESSSKDEVSLSPVGEQIVYMLHTPVASIATAADQESLARV